MPTFLEIPDLNQLQILAYLNVEDIYAIGKTCKALHQLVQQDELWKAKLILPTRRCGNLKHLFQHHLELRRLAYLVADKRGMNQLNANAAFHHYYSRKEYAAAIAYLDSIARAGLRQTPRDLFLLRGICKLQTRDISFVADFWTYLKATRGELPLTTKNVILALGVFLQERRSFGPDFNRDMEQLSTIMCLVVNDFLTTRSAVPLDDEASFRVLATIIALTIKSFPLKGFMEVFKKTLIRCDYKFNFGNVQKTLSFVAFLLKMSDGINAEGDFILPREEGDKAFIHDFCYELERWEYQLYFSSPVRRLYRLLYPLTAGALSTLDFTRVQKGNDFSQIFFKAFYTTAIGTIVFPYARRAWGRRRVFVLSNFWVNNHPINRKWINGYISVISTMRTRMPVDTAHHPFLAKVSAWLVVGSSIVLYNKLLGALNQQVSIDTAHTLEQGLVAPRDNFNFTRRAFDIGFAFFSIFVFLRLYTSSEFGKDVALNCLFDIFTFMILHGMTALIVGKQDDEANLNFKNPYPQGLWGRLERLDDQEDEEYFSEDDDSNDLNP